MPTVDKPEETEPPPPRRRGNLFFSFVLLLAIPMFYLASAGPVLYVARRLFGGTYTVGTGDFTEVVWQVYEFAYYPLDTVVDVFPPCGEYINWFFQKGLEDDPEMFRIPKQ